MTEIRFNGRTPFPESVPIGVSGENHSETLIFRLDRKCSGSLFLKLVNDDYVNKIPLSLDSSTAIWLIPQSVLQYSGRIHAQLQIESESEVVWQSYQFSLLVAATIDADEAIEREYPCVLRDFGQRISSLEKTGMSIRILGMLEKTDEFPESAENGDAYLVAGELWIYEAQVWINTGRLQGEKGDSGAQGSQGDKGDTGAQGPQGVKGDKGDTGVQGPQGVKGEKGDTGAQGPQGVKGEKGDGSDAYNKAESDEKFAGKTALFEHIEALGAHKILFDGKATTSDITSAINSHNSNAGAHGISNSLNEKANKSDIYTKTEVDTKVNVKANLASPALTGIPTAPTAAVGTNTTQIATMAALQSGLSQKATKDGTLQSGLNAEMLGGIKLSTLSNYLFGSSATLLTDANADNATTLGFAGMTDALAKNNPLTGYFYLINVGWSGNIAQLALGYNTTYMFLRFKFGGIWSAWVEK